MLLSVAHRSATHALRAAKAVTRTYAAATHAVSSDGTPTLLINGWAGCAADWGSLVDRLGASGRRIVAFDPRGFGASGDGAAASVRTLSEDLCGNQNFTARSC
jgi:pimeloyl-ACP methyl ester carboxylesterase